MLRRNAGMPNECDYAEPWWFPGSSPQDEQTRIDCWEPTGPFQLYEVTVLNVREMSKPCGFGLKQHSGVRQESTITAACRPLWRQLSAESEQDGVSMFSRTSSDPSRRRLAETRPSVMKDTKVGEQRRNAAQTLYHTTELTLFCLVMVHIANIFLSLFPGYSKLSLKKTCLVSFSSVDKNHKLKLIWLEVAQGGSFKAN